MKNQILYFEDVNLNENKIKGLAAPSEDKDGANKKYVDDEIKAIPAVDTSDGSRAMTGNLKMGDKKITDLDTQDDVPITDYPNYVKNSKMAVNKVYVNEHFLKLDDNSNYFDLKQKVIKDTEPFYDGLFSDNDLVSKAFVDAEIAKLPKPETDVLKLDGSRAMTGNLQMGDHTITGIRSSSQDNAALTVGASRSLYLPISGIRGMQGNLNMGGQSIVNLRPFVEIDSAQPAQDNEVINFGYFHTQRGDLKRLINEVASESLSRTDNGDKMEVNLNMNNNNIYNLADPITGTDALNLNFGNRKYLKVDGSNEMKGNLDMNNKQIRNLADGA